MGSNKKKKRGSQKKKKKEAQQAKLAELAAEKAKLEAAMAADESDSDDDIPELEDMTEQVEQRRKAKGMERFTQQAAQQAASGAVHRASNLSSTPTPDAKMNKEDWTGMAGAFNKSSSSSPAKKKSMKGQRVRLAGLSRTDLNGQLGVCGEEVKEKPGRHVVKLDSGKVLSLKATNLELVDDAAGAASSGTSSAEDDVPFIRANKGAQGKGSMPEVQEAMNKLDTSYIDDNFMSKLKNDDFLFKALSDPRLAVAMQEISKDPKAAKEKYKDNKELTTFLKKFMGFMGSHFEEKGDDEDKEKEEKRAKEEEEKKKKKKEPLIQEATPGDELIDFGGRKVPKKRVDKWMANPQIMRALGDPQTGALIAKISQDPSGDLYRRFQSHPGIAVLVHNGIIIPPAPL